MTTRSGDAGFWRPTPFEIASSWVHGRIPPPGPEPVETPGPRAAFEAAIIPALTLAPCFVAFSGGRDSSAVLAVATDVARRHGLPDPVPVTELYPGIPESDESEWQELVLSHLGLRDWLRLEFPQGNDFLGGEAQASLRRRGLIWPAALHVKATVLDRIGQSGTLLTGEGGDEVLGRRRGAQVSRLWRRSTARVGASDLRSALSTLSPEPLRRWRGRVRLDGAEMQPWLRPAARARHHRLLAADLASEPLSTSESLRWLLTRRAAAMASHNYTTIAAEHGLALHEPLLDPGFVHALAAAAGRWGFASRTDAMRAIFGDLLPDAILARRGKAYFNRAFMGEETRAFAESWDGSGLDPELVDPAVLRAEWLSPFPSAISTPLLQAAWLASTTPQHQGLGR
ncbi:asparagine synthase [Nocardioides seonyuensis]|uniref:Asparagine synthase n=1 Tax=Nocardioides seonyuensis TaxID=2518371 RepID=A0A4V1BLZ8_9ACTN|nr:asparagine synthase C-terminal domain-containing protein [Nocardioides seonyuensis]QBX54622.1 asparagine synthase [Nocardioides seonyuensis]